MALLPSPLAAQFVQGGNAFGTTAILGTIDSFPLEIRAGGSRVARYEPNSTSPNVIEGHPANSVNSRVFGATIGGGGEEADEDGEGPNRVTDAYGTVAGGYDNRAGGSPKSPTAQPFATVGGGRSNLARGTMSTVSGGDSNIASGYGSTVGGGLGNRALGSYSFAIGHFSVAEGESSIAMGTQAYTYGDGSFQFADANEFAFKTTAKNAFRARATGGVRFVVDIDASGNTTWSCLLTSGNGWACSSDRNLKQGLVELDGGAVLDKLVSLPVYQWQPKGRNGDVRHYGPMAQDFHATFGLGDDDKMLGLQDVGGVALSAIQGLNAKLEAKVAEQARALDAQRATLDLQQAEIATLRSAQAREIAELRRTVEVLLARTSPDGKLAAMR